MAACSELWESGSRCGLEAMLGILNGSRSNGRYHVLSGAGHYQANGLQGSLWPLKDSLEAMVRD